MSSALKTTLQKLTLDHLKKRYGGRGKGIIRSFSPTEIASLCVLDSKVFIKEFTLHNFGRINKETQS